MPCLIPTRDPAALRLAHDRRERAATMALVDRQQWVRLVVIDDELDPGDLAAPEEVRRLDALRHARPPNPDEMSSRLVVGKPVDETVADRSPVDDDDRATSRIIEESDRADRESSKPVTQLVSNLHRQHRPAVRRLQLPVRRNLRDRGLPASRWIVRARGDRASAASSVATITIHAGEIEQLAPDGVAQPREIREVIADVPARSFVELVRRYDRAVPGAAALRIASRWSLSALTSA
jgi:hypothetical protein